MHEAGEAVRLTKHTLLRRAQDLTIELTAASNVELILEGESFQGNHVTLAILDLFATSKTVETGLEELKPRIKGARAWLDCVQHVTALFRSGVLEIPDQKEPRLHSNLDGFNAAPIHIRMLNDRARTTRYQQAIRETVKAGDVVVDIGTGTGVLAVTAAKAGAKQVYAIESSRMGGLAQRAFAVNGLADRITLLEGRSTHLDLPEKADVLVSEIIGNDPLDEAILETTSDAVERLLKPGARLIPESLHIFGLPVSIPSEWLHQHVFAAAAAEQWQSWYDVDFSALADTAKQQNHSLFTSTFNARNWPRLTEPVLLAELDLTLAHHTEVKTQTEVPVTASGELNGIVVFFEAQLSRSVQLSIHPSEATQDNSWASKIWIAGMPVALEVGDNLGLRYVCGDAGSSFEIERRGSI